MPKNPTFPTLFDDALQISISKFKEWGYLKPDQIISSTLTWSNNGRTTGSISIKVNTKDNVPFIELDYKYKEDLRNCKIQLVSIPSNLGVGKVWYFLCPQTNKKCRKLYSIGGYFLHRESFTGCMYDCQTKSKKYRQMDKTFGVYFKSDELYSELHSNYFKTHYGGKPTKKYLRIIKQIQAIEKISHDAIIDALVK